jgi:hypothetical protein
VQDRFTDVHAVWEDRFAHTYGDWRPVVREVANKFLACGILDHGFARVRCDACAHEYLLAFSCKCRYFCPSCHAKRLELWTLWLEETLCPPRFLKGRWYSPSPSDSAPGASTDASYSAISRAWQRRP